MFRWWDHPLRARAQRSTKTKKEEREAEEGKQTQTPVKCLSPVTGPCKWSPLCLPAAAGNAWDKPVQVSGPAAPPSSPQRLWSCEETLTLWWQPPLYRLCLQTLGCAMVAPGACERLISNYPRAGRWLERCKDLWGISPGQWKPLVPESGASANSHHLSSKRSRCVGRMFVTSETLQGVGHEQ